MAQNTMQKKIAAIRAMHADVIDPDFHTIDELVWTAEKLAARIRNLSGVIQSPKWRIAVEQYALFVEDHAEHPAYAYNQGSVYFCSAVL